MQRNGTLELPGQWPGRRDRAEGWDDAFSSPDHFEGVRGRRVAAFLIDVLVLGVAAIILWVGGLVLIVLTLGLAKPLIALATALLPLLYHTWFIGSPGNATLGMRAMGLRVAVWNGNRPGYLQAALQTVLFYVTVPTTYGLVLLLSLFNERGRCLHDLMCGTVVINDLQRGRLAHRGTDVVS